MNKEQARQACRDAGISYSKLTVAQMIAAVQAKVGHKEAEVAEVVEEQVAPAALPVGSIDPKSPFSTLINNLASLPSEVEPEKVAPKKRATRVSKEATQNGIARPNVGTLCREVWDAMDEKREAGHIPSIAEVRQHAAAIGWNQNNATIEYYRWRKFNGICRK